MSFSEISAHPFIPATPLDRRSPCPALNALANHGYLPRNGQNIRFGQLTHAIQEVYNLSFPLAALLSLVGLVLCGHTFYLDLDALAIHNRIEHDASLVHANASGRRLAPTDVDPDLLESLLSYADPQRGLSLDDLAQARISREAQLSRPLDDIHSQIGTGEVALTWLLFKQGNGCIPSSTLSQWYGEERLPDNWVPPRDVVGLLDTRRKATEVGNIMDNLGKSTCRRVRSSCNLNGTKEDTSVPRSASFSLPQELYNPWPIMHCNRLNAAYFLYGLVEHGIQNLKKLDLTCLAFEMILV